MKTNELPKGTRVQATKGLWKGFVGIIEDTHPESTVIRLKSDDGETAYALKGDVETVQ